MKDFKQKPLIGLDDLNDTNYSLRRLSQIEVGKVTGKILGKKNAESGHMKSIQPLGASKGGKVGGVITRDSGKLKEHSKLGNLANIEKYGKRIVAYKKGTETPEYFDSIRLAERKLGIQAPLIRNVLRGVQPYSKGYRFEYSPI
jgi:hypothetical protein